MHMPHECSTLLNIGSQTITLLTQNWFQHVMGEMKLVGEQKII